MQIKIHEKAKLKQSHNYIQNKGVCHWAAHHIASPKRLQQERLEASTMLQYKNGLGQLCTWQRFFSITLKHGSIRANELAITKKSATLVLNKTPKGTKHSSNKMLTDQ